MQTGIVQTTADNIDNAYWQRYVEEGYRKGAGRAFDDVRKPALASGQVDVAFFQGSRAEFLRQSFGQPETVEKVRLLAGRVFTDLKGVNQAMATQMSRVLTDGLVQGQNPRTIAKTLSETVDKVGRRRAELIARTEIIRAHAEGQLDAMERLGVQEVGVMVEWSTAGDDRVCELCQPLEGVVLSLKEARGIIPRHPQCRCAYVPANVGEDKRGQKRGKQAVQEARDRSVKAEIPKRSKRTIAEQKAVSPWPGATKTVAKRRPVSVLDEPIKKVSPKPKPRLKPKPKPQAIPPKKAEQVIEATSRLADPKVQARIAEWETISSSKLPERLKATKLRKVEGNLALRGVRRNTSGQWFDTSQPKVTSPTSTSPKTVKTKPVKTDFAGRQSKWEASLSDKEREGIEFWSQDVYTVKASRDVHAGKEASAVVKQKVKAFDKAVSKAPKYEGTVYRGQSFPEGGSLKAGESFDFGHAVSSSKKLDVGQEFAEYSINDATIFEIRTKSGADISNLVLEEYKDQAEVYLRGKKYKVLSNKLVKDANFEAGQYRHILLEEVVPKSIPKVISKPIPRLPSKPKPGAVTRPAPKPPSIPRPTKPKLAPAPTIEPKKAIAKLGKKELAEESRALDNVLRDLEFKKFAGSTNKAKFVEEGLQNAAQRLGLDTVVKVQNNKEFNAAVKFSAAKAKVSPSRVKAAYSYGSNIARFREGVVDSIRDANELRLFLQTAFHELGHAFDNRILRRGPDNIKSLAEYYASKGEDFATSFGARLMMVRRRSLGGKIGLRSLEGRDSLEFVREIR